MGSSDRYTKYYSAYYGYDVLDAYGNSLPTYRSNVGTAVSCQRLCDMTEGCVGVVFKFCPVGTTCYSDDWSTVMTDPSCTLKSYIYTWYMQDAGGNYVGNTYVKIVQSTDNAGDMGMSMGTNSVNAPALTISSWIKTTDINRPLVSLGCSSDGTWATGSAFTLYVDDFGCLGYFEYSFDLGVGLYFSTQILVNNGYRTHVALVKSPDTYGGSVGQLYVNGTLAGTQTAYTAVNSFSDMQFLLGGDDCGFLGGAVLTGE